MYNLDNTFFAIFKIIYGKVPWDIYEILPHNVYTNFLRVLMIIDYVHEMLFDSMLINKSNMFFKSMLLLMVFVGVFNVIMQGTMVAADGINTTIVGLADLVPHFELQSSTDGLVEAQFRNNGQEILLSLDETAGRKLIIVTHSDLIFIIIATILIIP